MDIILLGDLSSSMTGYEDNVQYAFESFVDRFELSDEGIKMGAFVFAENIVKISPLTSDKKLLQVLIMDLKFSIWTQTTDINKALVYTADEFFENGRDGIEKYLIFISDGEPTTGDINNIPNILSTLKYNLNVNICSIYIGNSTNDEGRLFMQSVSNEECYTQTPPDKLIELLKSYNFCF
jgi:uncharacterized protein with von Willebrand factor type A (vWA) domain